MNNRIKIGDKLWFIYEDCRRIGFVTVVELNDDSIVVDYSGRKVSRPLTRLNSTLFQKKPKLNQNSKTYDIPINVTSYKDDSAKTNSIIEKENKRLNEKQVVQSTCENCYYLLNEQCTSLENIRCSDYRPRHTIDEKQRHEWPKYGDATAYRLKDRKHFN